MCFDAYIKRLLSYFLAYVLILTGDEYVDSKAISGYKLTVIGPIMYIRIFTAV